jgi:hypothetical protein
MFSFFARTRLVAFAALCVATGCGATKGADDTASFSYDHGTFDLTHPLAVGGTAYLYVTVPTGPGVASLEATPSTVVSVGSLTLAGSVAVAPVQGLSEGVSTVTAYDASGDQLGHATITVSPAGSLTVNAQTGLTVLVGGKYAAPVIANDEAGEPLVGSGNLQVTYAGAIAPAAVSWAPDAPIAFEAVSAGDGQVNVTAPSASSTYAVHVVAESGLDSLSFDSAGVSMTVNEGTFADYTLTSGGVTVYSDGTELACTSSDPSVATPGIATSRGLGGGAQTGQLPVTAVSSGSATFTCRVGSLVALLDVSVD